MLERLLTYRLRVRTTGEQDKTRARKLLSRLDDYVARKFPPLPYDAPGHKDDLHVYINCARAEANGDKVGRIAYQRALDLNLVPRLIQRWHNLVMDLSL